MNLINIGSFVPIATINVFTGTYCDTKCECSEEIWYPCHRKKYLENMIKSIEGYLKDKKGDGINGK